MRKTLPWVAVSLALAAVMLSWSCAKRGFPPGGPPDTTPPYVAEVSPVSGSVMVDLGSEIELQFSEGMKKRTVETGIVISPPCRWKKRHWQKETYIMVPQEGLAPNTTYLISVSNKIQDAHGVSMKSTFVTGFSTGDSLDTGIISGKVVWKKLDVEGAVIELFHAEAVDTAGGFGPATPLYVTLSGSGGTYEIPFVDTKKLYKVLSFIDKDLDSEYDIEEQVGCYPGVVDFGEETAVGDIDVMICGETLGGQILGRVDTTSVPDTISIGVSVHLLADPTVVYRATPGSDGSFALKCVEPGAYLVEAFFDLNANQKKDPEDSFFIELGETLSVESCTQPQEVEISFDHED
jgi:hypothetical protein